MAGVVDVGLLAFRTAVKPPTNFIANSVSSSQIALSWAAPAGFTVAAFEVERSLSASSGFTQVYSGLAVNTTTGSLASSTTYYFRARILDAQGNYSPYTAVVNATTQAAAIGNDSISDPVTFAANATGSGVRYDCRTEADLDAVPWSTLTPGSVVNIFWKSTPYKRKFGTGCVATAANPTRIVGVSDASGNRPTIDGNGATTCPKCGNANGVTLFNPAAPQFHESLGVIILQRPYSAAYGGPGANYVYIENLWIQGGANGNSFTTLAGGTFAYSSAAGFRGQLAQNCKVINCVITNNGFGVFEQEKDDILSEACASNIVEDCRVYGNGVSGSFLEHNFYRQGLNPITRGCFISKTRTGSQGSTYKSRCTGEQFHSNWVDASARALDFVECDDQTQGAITRSDYGQDGIWGNVITNDGSATNPIHYGGDNFGQESDGTTNPGATHPYRLHLRFFNNTFVSTATDFRATIFEVSLRTGVVDAWNNIIYVTSPHSWLAYAGQLNLRGNNLVFGTVADVTDRAVSGAWAVNRLGTILTSDPKFTNAATKDLSLQASSPALDLSTTPAGFETMTLTTGVVQLIPTYQPRSATNGRVARTVQGSAFDLGALERGLG